MTQEPGSHALQPLSAHISQAAAELELGQKSAVAMEPVWALKEGDTLSEPREADKPKPVQEPTGGASPVRPGQ